MKFYSLSLFFLILLNLLFYTKAEKNTCSIVRYLSCLTDENKNNGDLLIKCIMEKCNCEYSELNSVRNPCPLYMTHQILYNGL